MMRIVSDGTPQGTKVYDATGREIEGLSVVAWRVAGGAGHAQVTLEAEHIELDATGELAAFTHKLP